MSKLKYSTVPHQLIDGAAEAMAVGDAKYGENKRKEGKSIDDRYDSIMRHLQQYRRGEMDPESGLSPLKHVAGQLAWMLRDLEDMGRELYRLEPWMKENYPEKNAGVHELIYHMRNGSLQDHEAKRYDSYDLMHVCTDECPTPAEEKAGRAKLMQAEEFDRVNELGTMEAADMARTPGWHGYRMTEATFDDEASDSGQKVYNDPWIHYYNGRRR